MTKEIHLSKKRINVLFSFLVSKGPGTEQTRISGNPFAHIFSIISAIFGRMLKMRLRKS